jgi:BioD-like phosphotransacetylase family protein
MAAAPSAAVEEPGGKSKPAPSGRLLLRMPAQLHAELARAAEREGVSLNQFITGTLAKRIRWGEQASEPAAAEPADRTRVIVAALIANAVAIGLAAVTAVAILVLAWRG